MNFSKSAFPQKTAALSVALLMIAGCSVLPDSKKLDYKSASTTKLPSLEVPPDLTQPSRDERYAVPDIAPKGAATYSAYAGERGGKVAVAAVSGQEVLPDVGKMRIERAGSQRWLVIPGSPEKLWPTIRDFWTELGFVIQLEAPETGIMETDWAENRAKLPQDFIRGAVGRIFDSFYSTSERDKFRTRLERGAQAGMVEIYLSHRGMVELHVSEGKDATRWQPRPPDPELEAEMLRKLMMRLGADEGKAKRQLAEAPLADRAQLNRAPTGADVLNLDESFDRAWRRVGLALDRTGFTVEDRDRSQGLYFVRYMDPDNEMKPAESGGFLAKLMFWRDDEKKVAKPGDRFRIYVKDGPSGTTVQVMTREGGMDTSETGRKILGLLQDQLR